jgi:hypothetical protein
VDPVADIESLLWLYSHQLPDHRQAEFCRAAESALARLACLGPGVTYRTLAGLFSNYFVPPISDSDHHQGARKHRRSSKLISLGDEVPTSLHENRV